METELTAMDPDLEGKLWEAPEILAWMIAGCLDWQNEGLSRPETVAKATDQYFGDQDIFGEWVASCCVVGGTGDQTAAADLFSSSKVFAEAAVERLGT